MKDLLSIAIQKSGRLSEKSLEMIRNCGIEVGSDSRVLRQVAPDFPIEFLYVRDDDIPEYVDTGVADVGIVGRNEYDETGIGLDIIRDLKFAGCRLSIAVPRGFDYQGLKSLEGKRIATSYPRILTSILEKAGVKAELRVLSGSVEIACQVGIADAICDIVSTGTTLRMNGLEEVETIYRSTAILVARKDMAREKREILDRLLVRIDAVMLARKKKYILFNLPAERTADAAKIIGGLKSPTVTPLLEDGWVSVQSVVEEDRFWSVFEDLRSIGAEGILVMNVEKMTE